ncbi:hypothetical protein XAB3213_4920001 [Xanthomonas citri pv. bilvae]|nr:hypothetical protein XAB3213_4920001 [Xanthomonas citri pv. bilvae]
MSTNPDLIHAYTRADMLEDGELIDVTEVGREAGFTVPVALTRSVWADCVEWSAADNARKHACQDEAGRLWDVVYMARVYGHATPRVPGLCSRSTAFRAKGGGSALVWSNCSCTSDLVTPASR